MSGASPLVAARRAADAGSPPSDPARGADFARGAAPGRKATSPRHRFSAYGLVYDSDLPAPWAEPAPAGAPVDATVRLGPVRGPTHPERADSAWTVESPTEAYCDWEGLRLRVSDGARIGVEIGPGATLEMAMVHLGYAASTVLLHQRGAMPLHAAGAAGPAGGALLLGESGAGKSTFAAMMARGDWALAGDDTIALDLAPGRPVGLHRAMRTARLFADSARAIDAVATGAPVGSAAGASAPAAFGPSGPAAFGPSGPAASGASGPAASGAFGPAASGAPVLAAGQGMGKGVRALSDPAGRLVWPAPLRAVFTLEWLHPSDAPLELERLPTLAALSALRRGIGRPEIPRQMGLDGAYFRLLARVAAEVPVFALRRPRDFAAAEAAVALARRTVERLAPAPHPSDNQGALT
ncbi:hypothetical protein [uncultured Albimonas sp.]|uniref:hypothetical protein n=1 Tax=uncultured Albimonas sp. TaxID=1331701 RepID=UPI0030EF3825